MGIEYHCTILVSGYQEIWRSCAVHIRNGTIVMELHHSEVLWLIDVAMSERTEPPIGLRLLRKQSRGPQCLVVVAVISCERGSTTLALSYQFHAVMDR